MVFFVKPTVSSLLNQAESALLAGDYAAARERFLRVLDYDPDNRHARIGLIESYGLAAVEAAAHDEDHQ